MNEHQLATYDAEVRPLWDMTRVLFSDIDYCRKSLDGDAAQFWRRAYARAVCAFIEGVTAPMKQQALLAALNEPDQVDIGRVSVLIGETYTVNDNGEIKKRSLPIATLSGVALAFRCFAKAVGSTFQLDRSGSGWQALRQSFVVRDRIMHPKKLQDLNVTNSDVESFDEAARFIHNSLVDLMSESTFIGDEAVKP